MSVTETVPDGLGSLENVATLGSVNGTGGTQGAERRAPRTSRVVLRRVAPSSVLKLSLVFYACLCLMILVAGIVLWIGASVTGVVGNIESFFRDAGFDGFQFSPGLILRASVIGGLVLVAAGTVANMVLATLFNLMSDLVGGVRVTLDEDIDHGHGRGRALRRPAAGPTSRD